MEKNDMEIVEPNYYFAVLLLLAIDRAPDAWAKHRLQEMYEFYSDQPVTISGSHTTTIS